jgi:aminoglycoside phosphotransferase (APT) family kinase protein/SAM-dependent methyltransferase
MSRHPDQTLENLAKHYGWDDELIRLLGTLPRAASNRYIEQAWSYDQDGWRHILPPLPPSASVLCLDARFGNTAAAFAEAGFSVTVVHPCPVTVRIIRYRLTSVNLPNVQVIHIPAESARLPFPDERFDAFVHHDVVATLLANPATASSPCALLSSALFDEIFRVLKSGGFAHFGAKNPWGYSRLLQRLRCPLGSLSGSSRLAPLWRLKRLAVHSGFRNLHVYPYMVENDRVVEVIAPSGYQSTKNSLAVNEKFKQSVLGKTGAKYLAPAYGLVCAKDRDLDRPLQKFIKDLASRKILSEPREDDPGFRRYLALPGKAIVTLGKAADGEGNVIIVIPKVARVLAWRRKEIGIVNEVRALSPFLAARLPRLYTECCVDGETYFAISEIPGMTVDSHVRHLERLTLNAVDFLIRFNQITARAIIVDDVAFENLFGAIVRQVITTYPETRPIVERIEVHLRRIVHGRNMVTVWLHGDYKMENIIFDKETLGINGIIDWEHSRRNNLPWLDLMYLVTYNRIVSENLDFFEAYREVIFPENHSDHEKSVIAAYAGAFPVTPDMKTVLSCLFFLHHIGFRYIYIMSREGDRRNIFSALDDIEKRLARLIA